MFFINCFFIGLLVLNSFFGWLYFSIILFISYIASILLSRKLLRNEIILIFLLLAIFILFIQDLNYRVVSDMLRYLTPAFAFYIGYRLSNNLSSIKFNRLILISCIAFFICAFGILIYGQLLNLSAEGVRKTFLLSPFAFIYFWILISSSRDFIYSNLYRNLFFVIGLLLLLLQESRTIYLILTVCPIIYIISQRSFKIALISLLVFITISIGFFQYFDEIISRGITELFYTPGTHGLSRSILYQHWRGFEIYSVIKAMLDAPIINVIFGHGLGSGVPLGFNIPIAEGTFNEIQRVHSLYFEVLFKFGFVGVIILFYIFYKILVDIKIGSLTMRLILVSILLISTTVTAGILQAWIFFVWWGFQSFSQERT